MTTKHPKYKVINIQTFISALKAREWTKIRYVTCSKHYANITMTFV